MRHQNHKEKSPGSCHLLWKSIAAGSQSTPGSCWYKQTQMSELCISSSIFITCLERTATGSQEKPCKAGGHSLHFKNFGSVTANWASLFITKTFCGSCSCSASLKNHPSPRHELASKMESIPSTLPVCRDGWEDCSWCLLGVGPAQKTSS